MREPACCNRRQWVTQASGWLGAWATSSLLASESPGTSNGIGTGGALPVLHHPAKAKRVISLFMHGGPSQIDLFDYKPNLRQLHGQELPASVRGTQRLTGMTSGQKTLPLVSSPFQFSQHGASGMWFSELLPELAKQADSICVVRTVHTEAINHDPGVTFLQTGHQQPGRPSFGSWLSYGLGNSNRDLPAFMVLLSRGSSVSPADPLFARLWGAGFLPSNHQGVSLRSSGEPVLYLANPPGVSREDRRRMLDTLGELNQRALQQSADPEIATRIAQYEMAFQMQTSMPDLIDLSREPRHVLDLYGPDVQSPGSFAANCLLARRMAERGVRFIQLYHRGWDQHYNLPSNLRLQCQDIDQPCAGLLRDLAARGLLDDTLVVWGGEFGRTVYSQGKLTENNFGRDHHPRCFTMWLAGGGIRPGLTYGTTDDFSYNVLEKGVSVHDLHATLLHCLGVDHLRLTFRFQGRDYRLTDLHGEVLRDVLA